MAITLHVEEKLPEQVDLEVGRVRDEFQLQVDKDVLALKERTAKAKWPEPDPTKLYHHYIVSSDDMAALKGVVRRACLLNKVEAIFYKNAKTEAGHIVVKFHVARKPLMKDGKEVTQNGQPVYVPDDTLNDDGTWKTPKAT